MENPILISMLNDFSFCPYSIYLHNVYKNADKEMCQSLPQLRGTIAHENVDNKTSSTLMNETQVLPISSEQLGVMGKIDIYRANEKILIERKYKATSKKSTIRN
ncbi:MAG: type V CRISPR-associated protein Cas4 [Bacteroidales bacterium]|nr:type V CRISPR-associated protein Cas4 [Bacteroidales bacterium]